MEDLRTIKTKNNLYDALILLMKQTNFENIKARLLQLILLEIYSLPFLNKGFIMSILYIFELCIFMYRAIILS